MPEPPPLPPEPVEYRSPPMKGQELGSLGKPQLIFDTVAVPNLRLRDNLIQLLSIVAAVAISIPIFLAFSRDVIISITGGTLVGLIAGVFISGIALGIYRFVKGVSRK